MKIFITTYGTRGDVQPYLALAKGLLQKGHQVLLATSSRFEKFVKEQDVEFSALSDELLRILDSNAGKDLLENTDTLFKLIKQGLKLKAKATPLNRELLNENWQIAERFQPDAIVYHPKSFAAPHIAEKLKIKPIFATPIPVYIPTAEYSFINFPNFRFSKTLNRYSFYFVKKLTEFSTRSMINDFRKNLGLAPLRHIDLVKTHLGEDIASLHLHSEHLLKRPQDWPRQALVTGYCFLQESSGWKPPQELLDFLAQGPPPIYVGFGSMAGRDPEKLGKTVVEALLKSKQRGILATGWGGLSTHKLPDSIFKIDQVPHDWLLPKVSAVIHHGGAGTTAAGLRAGKPTLIIPFFGDQPFWGEQVFNKGVGPRPIRRKKLTVENLSRAMQELTSNESLKQCGNEVGLKIASENGVQNTIAEIEKILL